MKRVLSLLALLTTTSIAHADLIILKDLGGLVQVRQDEINQFRQEGKEVRIYGICASACTMYLGLGDLVCSSRDAEWQFHGPLSSDGKTRLSPVLFDYISNQMAQNYPAPLADWFMRMGRYRFGSEYYSFSGATMIDMGLVRDCSNT